MWFNILKKPMLSLGDLELPDLSDVPESSCRQELFSIRNKLAGLPLLTKETDPMPEGLPKRAEGKYKLQNGNQDGFPHKIMYYHPTNENIDPIIVEIASYWVRENIPEDVACAILNIIESETPSSIEMWPIKHIKVKDMNIAYAFYMNTDIDWSVTGGMQINQVVLEVFNSERNNHYLKFHHVVFSTKLKTSDVDWRKHI